jgi:tetratricopeptide (TPR) repeat protein
VYAVLNYNSNDDASSASGDYALAYSGLADDRDWLGAEREFKRAIELNPNYPQAHHWYAIYLVWAGRTNEGLAEIRRAQELDPLSLPINMTVGWLLCDAQRMDEGIDQLHKTLEMDPAFAVAHVRLEYCYERKGDYDAALAEAQRVFDLGRKVLGIADLAQAYALAGKRSEAQEKISELQELAKERYVSPSLFALAYAAIGDKDQAFAWLEKSIDEHDLVTVRLKVDHRFANLRSDPRFAVLVKRVGLQP